MPNSAFRICLLNPILVKALCGAAACLLPVVSGCQEKKAGTTPQPPPAERERVVFTDITERSGVRFRHDAGATGTHYFVETMGAGVAFIDYDRDGRQDLLFLNGARLQGYRPKEAMLPAFYRNLGQNRFEDVTRKAGLAKEMYGMGIAVGDYDNDGDDDLYLTATLGPSFLYRNNGNGTFTDIASSAGVARPSSFPASAAWLDYDKDGDLDLYVANYVRYRSVKDDMPCYFKEKIRSYCIPFAYKAEPDSLFENLGNGKFRDVARKAGVEGFDGKSLGIGIWDLNNDTWPDIVVANDTTPTHAYINQKNGTFKESAGVLGVAYGMSGMAKAGMGIDIADDRNNGFPTVVMSNFSGEMVGLYRDNGTGFFEEQSVESGVGGPSEQLLGFGIFFFDYNNDGWQDLFVANGHVQDHIAQFSEGVAYREPPLLFRNQGAGKYVEVAREAGEAMQKEQVSRGAAWGDLDDDGRLDIVLNNNQEPARVLLNQSEGTGNWLKVLLIGVRSNRNGFGARLSLVSAAGTQTREARSGSSYCSQFDQRLQFGLGPDAAAKELRIVWPSGVVDVLRDVPGKQTVTVREGSHPDKEGSE